MKKLRFLIIICFTSASYSQDTKNNQSLFLTFSGGTALNNPINYYFYREIDDQLINPGVHISLGVGYGSINFLELSQLYFNISLGYNKVSTSEFQLENVPSNAILIIETYPILLWSRLQTNTRLSPFIEIGFGVSKLNFIERYSKWLNGASFSNWAFGYGFGVRR